MNCEQIRQMMRERFDEGLRPPPEAEAHMASCGACRDYHERLLALDAALGALPLEAPAPALNARIRRGLAGERKRRATMRLAAALGCAAVMAALLFTGWFYPVPVEPELWYAEAAAWASAFESPDILAELAAFADTTYESARDWRALTPDVSLPAPAIVSGLTMWLAAAGTLLALVAVNGWHMACLENPNNHSKEAQS